MNSITTGAAVLAVTALVFWRSLPRDRKMHRFVGTELEPYVAVVIVTGIAMSFCLILSGFIGK
jgi:hypothetical protein